jgi:hypothetical protein
LKLGDVLVRTAQNNRFLSFISRPFKQDAPYDRHQSAENFAEKVSRFPARCRFSKYETILLRKKNTPAGRTSISENKESTGSPACAGGNHLARRRNVHITVCANHYHL